MDLETLIMDKFASVVNKINKSRLPREIWGVYCILANTDCNKEPQCFCNPVNVLS